MDPTLSLAELPESDTCAVCGAAGARHVREERAVSYQRQRVVIEDDFYRCAECGEEYYWPVQLRALEARAAARLKHLQVALAPEEIRALRERLGLTQYQFEHLLGVGKNTVVRWESGQVRPNAATDSLLRLLDANPENARLLARWHGVQLGTAA